MAVTKDIAPTSADTPATFHLRLLATSDLHARIMPYDYAADRPLAHAGLALTATLIRAARAEVTNSLTFDNGDFLEGEPLNELHTRACKSGQTPVHPVIASMNAVGYDAAGLGNHEFNYGLGFLTRALRDADFPVLCANAVKRLGTTPTEDSPFLPPTLILDRWLDGPGGRRAPIRIGLIGLLPPQVAIWERKYLEGQIQTRDIVATAEAWVPRLKADGADLVVALCHSGIGGPDHEDGMENAAVPLARVAGIDVIIAGHTHLSFPGPDVSPGPDVDPRAGTLCGKPAVMMGFWGSHLGLIDLDLRLTDEQGWAITSARASTRALQTDLSPGGQESASSAARVSDPQVTDAVVLAHQAALDFARQPVGATGLALHSYFAQVADSAALTLIHAAQLDWLGRVLAGSPFANLPMLSAASPFKSGGRGGPDFFTDVAPGPLYQRSLYDLYMFPNSIRALMITGATLHEWLERSAAHFLQLVPDQTDQPLLHPDAPAYNFDTISGVSYAFDLSGPARYGPHGALINPQARRLRHLSHDGRPVAPEDRFTIVTNNFRAMGGGGYPLEDAQMIAHEPTPLTVDVVKDYVRRASPVHPAPRFNWRLSGLPQGTAAWFDTGPGARPHLDDPAASGIEAFGASPGGFLRCRLWFGAEAALLQFPPATAISGSRGWRG